MILQYLLEEMNVKKVEGNVEINIQKIEYDSKKITNGDLFVAINGYEQDGNDYVEEAIKNGATVIVTSDENIKSKYSEVIQDITIVIVEDSRIALA